MRSINRSVEAQPPIARANVPAASARGTFDFKFSFIGLSPERFSWFVGCEIRRRSRPACIGRKAGLRFLAHVQLVIRMEHDLVGVECYDLDLLHFADRNQPRV